MKGKERRENNARITRLWRGEGHAALPCLKTLSDDLLLDNFHWSKVSDKEYDLFRAELVRRLNPNPSESRFNEIDNKLEQILYRSTGKTFQQIADDLNQNKTVAEFSRDINAHAAALGKAAKQILEPAENPINTPRTCTAALEYKTDGDGNPVVLECNRLRDHRGAHRGKYAEEVIRWK